MKQENDRLSERDRQVFLNGVQKFILKGIPVFINGEKVDKNDLEKLFSPPEGTFYMADFVIEEMPEANLSEAVCANECPVNMMRERVAEETPYSSSGGRKRYTLKEIRFDPAYHS